MKKEISTRYPLKREKQSIAFAEGLVSFQQYTTNPELTIRIKGNYTEDQLSDLQNAVDEVLKHHNR